MIECVILFRRNDNSVDYLADDSGSLKVFEDHETAVRAANASPDCRNFPYQIVPLDEL